MKLCELQADQPAKVTAVLGSGSYRRRLLELGLVPNALVKLIRVAPLGDPIEFEVRGAHLSIRKSEANQVEVEPA